MTPKNDPEIRGNFLTHPFAEVLTELTQARLSGRLRVAAREKKTVLYFRDGRLAFGVSNARESRLYHLLLSKGKLTEDDLRPIPNFTNDFELAAYLLENKLMTDLEHGAFLTEQVSHIVVDVLGWQEGEWSFSHLARARDGLDLDVPITEILVDYGRTLPQEQVLKRFRSLGERFWRSELPMSELVLSQNEAFVVSRAEHGVLAAADLARVAAMPEPAALKILYTMWLAGYLERSDWQAAFDGDSIESMRYARLEIKKEAKVVDFAYSPSSVLQDQHSTAEADLLPTEVPTAVEVTMDVDEFLDRVENSTTYYDVLGVDVDADASEIRRIYLSLAKQFHPDRFHSGGPELRKRVQNAFTQISQASETFKDPKAREVYNYRMRAEITARKNAQESGESVSVSVQLMQASDAFERGFTLLKDGHIDDALPLLGRAVHYAPKNARYHAYYGKALSSDKTNRHKAEAEMQAAVKIDPENTTFRLMLAEFFIEMGLRKRAEGELNRLLSIFPSNTEAQTLLASLVKP